MASLTTPSPWLGSGEALWQRALPDAKDEFGDGNTAVLARSIMAAGDELTSHHECGKVCSVVYGVVAVKANIDREIMLRKDG